MSRVFGALVLALGPAAAVQACSDAMTSAATPIEDANAEGDSIAAEASGDAADDGAVRDAGLSAIDAVCTLTETLREAGPDAGPDADPGCRYVLPCGIAPDAAFHVEGCGLYSGPSSSPDSALGCWVPDGLGCMADAYVPPANGSLTFDCFDCFGGGGRRPVGLAPARACAFSPAKAGAFSQAQAGAFSPVHARSPLALYFSRMAYDEAASVHAFVGLEADLVRFGAPAELIAAAARSARDEVRHARVMARRARACGGVIVAPRVRRRQRAERARSGAGSHARGRSLEAIARENAVEGCVHEMFGALQLRWQAVHAPDASLRRMFARIAADETRHAALSRLVARWAESQLDAAAQKRVAAASARATRALRTKLETTPARPFDRRVGRPLPKAAVALLDGLMAGLG